MALEIPPFLQSMIDQDDAHNRDLVAELIGHYREHSQEDHEGEPSPCSRTIVMMRTLGVRINRETLEPECVGPPLSQPEAASLIGYLVERAYTAERTATDR